MRQRKNSKSFTVGHTGALEGEMSFGQLPNSPARRQQAGGSAKGRVATNSVPPGQAVGGEGSSAHGPSLHATSHASQGALSSLVPSNSSRSLSAGDLGAAGSQHPPERVSRNGMPVAGAAVSRFGVEAAGRAHGLGSAASVAGAGGVGSTGGAPPFSRPSLIQQPQHPGGMRGAHSLGDLAVHGSELSHTGPHGTNRGDAASLGATSVPPGQGRKGNTQFKRGIRVGRRRGLLPLTEDERILCKPHLRIDVPACPMLCLHAPCASSTLRKLGLVGRASRMDSRVPCFNAPADLASCHHARVVHSAAAGGGRGRQGLQGCVGGAPAGSHGASLLDGGCSLLYEVEGWLAPGL